jgi:hypothetical protein
VADRRADADAFGGDDDDDAASSAADADAADADAAPSGLDRRRRATRWLSSQRRRLSRRWAKLPRAAKWAVARSLVLAVNYAQAIYTLLARRRQALL